MRIAIGIADKENKAINELFARAPFFLISDIEDGKVKTQEVIDNVFANQTSGAGTAVVESLAKMNIDVIIAANLGPKALDLCKQLSIKAYRSEKSDSDETIQQLFDNKLEEYK